MSHIINIIWYLVALCAVAERLEAGPKQKVDNAKADMAVGHDQQLYPVAFWKWPHEYLDNLMGKQRWQQQMKVRPIEQELCDHTFKEGCRQAEAAEGHGNEKSLVELNSSSDSPCMKVVNNVMPTFKSFEKVGEGNFGLVYRGELKKTGCEGTQFILKCMREETIAWNEALFGESPFFFGEEGLMATYSHAAFPDQHSILVVMEYADSGDLLSNLGRGQMSIRKRARLFHETLLALDRLHQFGIVHRDIRPANIFLVEEKQSALFWSKESRYHPLIGGFGFACCTGRREKCVLPIYVSCKESYFGSPAYMSPRVAQGIAAAPDDDLWAMGQILQDIVLEPDDPHRPHLEPDDVGRERAKVRERCAATASMKQQLQSAVMRQLKKEGKNNEDYNFDIRDPATDPLGILLDHLLCNDRGDRRGATTMAIAYSRDWMNQLKVEDFSFKRDHLSPKKALECLGKLFNRDRPSATTTA